MKRSKTISLALMGVCPFVLTACSEPEQEALIYPSAQACIDDGKLEALKCEEEYAGAIKEHERTAQKYTSYADCVSNLGQGQCYQPQGSSYFMPLMAGYMMGRMGGMGMGGQWRGASPVYHPQNDPNSWRTSDGRNLGSGQGRVMVPASATKPKISAAARSRGGFGSQGAARSSWGS